MTANAITPKQTRFVAEKLAALRKLAMFTGIIESCPALRPSAEELARKARRVWGH